jgi:Proteasome regulatory subunit C-terminal
VDHEAGVMVCRESGDVYGTAEPAAAFHARTAFCLDIHNEVRPLSTARAVVKRCGLPAGGGTATSQQPWPSVCPDRARHAAAQQSQRPPGMSGRGGEKQQSQCI